jgi:hypothetical protein
VAAASGVAQARRAIPVITLDKGATEFAEPFSVLSDLVELRSGRLLVNDSKENEVSIVDFAAGTKKIAARKGAGPLEFEGGSFLDGVSDTIAYYDIMQTRFLLFSPAGVPLRTVSFGGGDGLASLSRMVPRYVDAAGRVYGQGMGMNMPDPMTMATGSFEMKFADTVTIERFNLRTARTDTLARVLNPAGQVGPKTEMGENGAVRMTMSATDLRAMDVWTVLADGTVAILRDGVYRVRFASGPGPARQGPVIEHPTIPVTAAMKRSVVDSMRATMTRMIAEMGRTQGGSGNDPGPLPKFSVEVREPLRWAATLSPYQSITATPDDQLWVGITSAVSPLHDYPTQYDVLDRTGVLIARVVLAGGERIVGHGRGVVYTVRKDADDLQYLRRYAVRF